MPEDWDKIFSKEEMDELSDRMDRIVYNNENGFIATMSWTIEQCVNMVWNYYNQEKSDDSVELINEFIDYFVKFLEDYLIEEGIDYNDEYQG